MIHPLLHPMNNPIFIPTLLRVILLFIFGFFLILILNKFNVSGLFKTNLGQRYIGWLLVVPLYVMAIFYGGFLAELIIAGFLFLGIWEINRISKIPKSYVYMMVFLALVSIYVAAYKYEFFYTLPVLYFMVFTLLGIRENNPDKSQFNVSLSLYVSIWLIFSLCHFVLLNRFNHTLDNTKSLLILVGFAVPLSDIFAYLAGNFFKKIDFLDKYKVASNLSKNKTYAGSLGNIAGAYLGIYLMYFIVGTYLSLIHWVFIGALIGIMGLIGDITESMFKRYYHVKDSGSIIPGHGGVLDRLDSVLRVVVVLYYYFLVAL